MALKFTPMGFIKTTMYMDNEPTNVAIGGFVGLLTGAAIGTIFSYQQAMQSLKHKKSSGYKDSEEVSIDVEIHAQWAFMNTQSV